jgi:hypothetical protein
MFGDALADAQKSARASVYRAAGSYRLPAVPRNRAEAIMALLQALQSARSENPQNRAHYTRLELVAPYQLRAAPPRSALVIAEFQTRTAPRTHTVVEALLKDFDAAEVSSQAAPPAPPSLPAPPLDPPAAPAWHEQIPGTTGQKVAAGAALLGLLTWALWPVKRSAP